MKTNLTFHFTPDKSDYIKPLRAFAFHQKSNRIVLVFFGTVLILGFIGFVVLGYGTALWNYLLPWIFLVFVFYLITLFFLNPMLAARQIQKSERSLVETTWEVNDNSIKITNSFSETKFDWGTFDRVIETKTHYLFTYSTNNRLIQILPKRAFISQQQQDEFRSLIGNNIQKWDRTKI